MKKRVLPLPLSNLTTIGFSRRHKRTHRSLYQVGIVVFVFFLTSGCVPSIEAYKQQASPQSNTAAPTRILDTTQLFPDTFLHLRSDAIVLTQASGDDFFRISANHPTQALWTHRSEDIVWVEESPTTPVSFSLQEYHLKTGEQQQLYWSKSSLQQLRRSSQSQFVSFVENNALFVLSRFSGEVFRIAEHVEEYAWSLEGDSLVVDTGEEVFLAHLDTQPTVPIPLNSFFTGRLDGFAFISHRSLVGFIEDDTLDTPSRQLVKIDLRTGEQERLLDWEHQEGNTYTLFVAPRQQSLVVEERSQDSALTSHTKLFFVPLTLPSSSQEFSATLIDDSATMVGWLQNRTLILLRPSSSTEGQYDLYEKDIQSQEEVRIAEEIFAPVFTETFLSP